MDYDISPLVKFSNLGDLANARAIKFEIQLSRVEKYRQTIRRKELPYIRLNEIRWYERAIIIISSLDYIGAPFAEIILVYHQ